MSAAEAIPGTVCCILCRGLVIYNNYDKSRFKAHLANEHGAFFDVDYLLASSLMGIAQKAEVAKTVNFDKIGAESYLEKNPSNETVKFNLQEATNDSSKFVCGTCATHFSAKTVYLQHVTNGCKKEELKNVYICTVCDEAYSTEGNLNVHMGSHHIQVNFEQKLIKQEKAEEEESQLVITNQHKLSKESYDSDINLSFNRSELNIEKSDQLEESSFHKSTSEQVKVNEEITSNFQSSLDVEKLSTNIPCECCQQMFVSAQALDNHMVKKHSYRGIGDNSMDIVNDASNYIAVDGKPLRAFLCRFSMCTKSYSAKESLGIHERRAHERPLLKRGRTRKVSNNESSYSNESNSSPIKNQVGSNTEQFSPGPALLDDRNQQKVNNAEVGATNFKVAETPSAQSSGWSFLTDSTLDFDSVSPKSAAFIGSVHDNNEISETKPSVDLTKSKYFIKNPNVISNARGKSIQLFSEGASELPEGWKMRTIEVKLKTGGLSSVKHYLTPDTKVLKNSLAVIEYLRLEGNLNTGKLLEISRHLHVSEKKLKQLFSVE